MCLYPKLIKNPKYKATKKNGGIIPAVLDNRVKYVPIGCQRCMECRKKKAREWQLRLSEDIKKQTNGKFITLTFSNEDYKKIHAITPNELTPYDKDNYIATYATRHFLERWRKKYKKSLRHWLVTELGHNGTHNIHLHGIIWTNENYNTIAQYWKYGHIWPDKDNYKKTYVNLRTVNYIIKYVSKMDNDHKHYNSIILTSPGIGNNYTNTYNSRLNKYNGQNTIETYRTTTGHKINMPIYWRNKIYSEKEREELWLLKLDKQERWIMKEKVSVKNGEEEYNKLLKWYQQQNIKLGYQTDTINWTEKKYEQEKRQLMQQARIKNKKSKQATNKKIDKNKKKNTITINNRKWQITEFGLTTIE
ncbi:MAG: replication initiator protein [Microviridae sp.]|nr:MAG: replication initiator protein [Microviridae sp.]